jgi:hypothetical protein
MPQMCDALSYNPIQYGEPVTDLGVGSSKFFVVRDGTIRDLDREGDVAMFDTL